MSPEKIVEVARVAVRLLLELLPHDEARALLDEEAVKRANAVADAAERLKFPEG